MDFLWQDITHAAFWIAALQIIGVNIILSGDNAVVIAMACMTLPPRQRLWGMILGAGVAVLLRVIFTLVIAQVMNYPYLKLVGGLLLFYVAIKLVTEDADGEEGGVESASRECSPVSRIASANSVRWGAMSFHRIGDTRTVAVSRSRSPSTDAMTPRSARRGRIEVIR